MNTKFRSYDFFRHRIQILYVYNYDIISSEKTAEHIYKHSKTSNYINNIYEYIPVSVYQYHLQDLKFYYIL